MTLREWIIVQQALLHYETELSAATGVFTRPDVWWDTNADGDPPTPEEFDRLVEKLGNLPVDGPQIAQDGP